MLVSTSIIFPSANSTEYLVSIVDGTMSLKGLILAEVRLLSTRFHLLVIIVSIALTSVPSEVLSVRESYNLRDSNSRKGKNIEGNFLVLLGVGFGLSAKGVVSLCDRVT
ncbi:hypothetical protein Tco_0838411 [Tanacetum coccineum]|uniref:Uncharacterized protein n=1 Tax=Tanacetum coccineum TaxID=301880 RepID=A0ABQ5APH7_9ASTR